MATGKPLVSGFVSSAKRFPDRVAVRIQAEEITYAELARQARGIAATLQSRPSRHSPSLCGVFGHRSFAAFAGILGALLEGSGYVPLNPVFPRERTLQMIRRAQLDRVVVAADDLDEFLAVADDLADPVTVIVPDAEHLDTRTDVHTYVCATDLEDESGFTPPRWDAGALAYLLFTSGSTGVPKGVMVTQRNVTAFVDYMVERYAITEEDRFSQTFDLTFDLSAFDMFVAWERGACVCCPTQGEKLLPSKFIKGHGITVWFSVPSTAIMMKKLRMLKPGSFPTIRLGLFCGEALPIDVVEAFRHAAPNATLENLYGPTELTIACTLYRYDADSTPGEAEMGIVPIGSPYPEMKVLIADETLAEVAEGEPGELLMTGPQLTKGYWNDPDKTGDAFVVPPGKKEVYYRTGDRVRQRPGNGPLLYLGRVDNQIKVQGYRVELGEIEALIRKIASVDIAIALGHPVGASGADGLVAFMGESAKSGAEVCTALAERLPPYMQPREVLTVRTFPLNANGKVDRKALLARYVREDDKSTSNK